MAVSHEFDLVVVGGGAAGITAATEARRRGARTALISHGPVGGECTFTGCVPSKTLLAAAPRGESFASAMATVQRVAAGDEATLSRDGVEVIRGHATLVSPTELDDPAPIPWVTFTAPEVGRVGMTEAQAADHGGRVAYLALDEVDRALTAGETRGFVKLIAGPRRLFGNGGGGRILGATVVAPTGGELIHEPALAMHTGMFTGRLAQATHAYPTWSMAIQQAAAQFFVELDGRTARPAHPTGDGDRTS